MNQVEEMKMEEAVLGAPVGMSVEELDVMVNGKSRKDLYIGLAAGTGIGLTVGGTAWYLEKHMNNKLLKAFEEAITIAAATRSGMDEVTIGKKTIKIDGREIENTVELVLEVNRNLDSIKGMSKKKKKRWMEVMQYVIELAKADQRTIEKEAYKAKMQEFEETTVIKEAEEA